MSRKIFGLLFTVVLLGSISLGAPALLAQTATTALLTGVVSDQSGAVVANATITLVQQGTNVEQTTVSDAAGRYVFPALVPSDYIAKFAAKGFQVTVVNDLHVEVGKSYTVNTTLKIGEASQTVTVTEVPTAELQTTNSTIGTVLGGVALDALPVFTRSASALMFYQPGIAPSGQISGARTEQVTFALDGGDVTSDLEGSNSYAGPPGEPSPSPVVPVPIESTEEFQVATANPNASFGRSSGGQVALMTKAGSNAYHGSVYEYHNDDALNANGWGNDRLGLVKPQSVDNRFGATFGGPILKQHLWAFVNYEGRRFHDSSTFTAVVPTASLQQGILKFPDASTPANIDSYSFQPGSITTACGGVSCDPRNLGFNSVIKSQLALYPAGNNSSVGDGLNTTGFTFNTPTPIRTDIGVVRLDYRINDKWSAFVTYHYARTDRVGTEQFSILNTQTPTSTAGDPIKPAFYTFEVTSQLTPTLTSVSHGSFMRDWWGWNRIAPEPLVSGTQQALVLAGEGSGTSNSTSKLLADPVNLATQSARGRFFDGRKWYLAQDFSLFRGSHLLQFGASGSISHDIFEKTDNFAGGLTAGPLLYSESKGNGSGEFLSISSTYQPQPCSPSATPPVITNCLTSGNVLRWNELYTTLLGMVDRSSQVITRNGQFQPNPLGTPAISHTFIPAVNLYFQDVWQVRPSFTLTYGLNWGAQPTPTEADGKYDVLVYASTNTPVDYFNYLQNRAASLNVGVLPGQAYNPLFGVTPVNYLADPMKGALRITNWAQFAPRISVAWKVPWKNRIFGDNKTVIRAGYSIVYDRMSDINQDSLPLTTGGLLDVSACGGPTLVSGSVVCTNAGTDPTNAFRIGTDGNSVPIPAATAVPIPYVVSGSASAPFGLFMMSGLDPFADPGHSHAIDFTLQRSLPGKMLLEIGYIGRFSRNLPQDIAYNASDYLMKDKASGQTLAQAFDGLAVPLRSGIQPVVRNSSGTIIAINPAFPTEAFFENQVGAASCTAQVYPSTAIHYQSCSALLAFKDSTDLVNGSLNSFSLDELNLVTPTPLDNIQSFQSYGITDRGFSNYNAGFLGVNKSFANGFQFQANWTWSHAIGNQGVDQQNGSSANSPYNLSLDKSSETFDRRHVFNLWAYYQLPFGKGTAHNLSGAMDKIAGGWYTAGIYTFYTGTPLHISADGDYGAYESNGTAAICSLTLHGLEGENFNVVGSSGIATSGNASSKGTGLNMFANPVSVAQSCSRPLLSVNGQIPFDQLRLLPRWNLDFTLGKRVSITERMRLDFSLEALNMFNVVNFSAPSLNLNSLTNFGVYTSQGNTPRRLLLGAKFEF